MYVVGIDASTNTVILGEEGRQLADTLTAGPVNYVSIAPPAAPLRVQAKIRYQAPAAPATLTDVYKRQPSTRPSSLCGRPFGGGRTARPGCSRPCPCRLGTAPITGGAGRAVSRWARCV